MPPLLLDENLSRALLAALNRRGFDAIHLADVDVGVWRTSEDSRVLSAATATGRILVSYDAATLPALARDWAKRGIHHAGILIVAGGIYQADIGTQLAAIESTLQRVSRESWDDLLIFATRNPS